MSLISKRLGGIYAPNFFIAILLPLLKIKKGLNFVIALVVTLFQNITLFFMHMSRQSLSSKFCNKHMLTLCLACQFPQCQWQRQQWTLAINVGHIKFYYLKMMVLAKFMLLTIKVRTCVSEYKFTVNSSKEQYQ
ncbi:MAG: hypothetical protein V7771_11055 [Shewanella psychromarinicola]|jgi:hypothetical protein|uniref:hypothetical protein n=1 Tax=Shewanella psychromarinicola TaxID=2487742 RepID=UPI0030034AEA|tara:strand:+ start:34773 stop:35174 length:402 start_codon:yes stop_codon:yes gene_type:complete